MTYQAYGATMNLELAIKALRDNGYTVTKRKPRVNQEFADYDMSKVKNAKVAFPSPVIAATFEDGEYIRMSFATAVGKPLNAGRAVRIATDAYTARNKVRQKKTIADEIAAFVNEQARVVSLADRVESTREKAIEAAEAYEEFKVNNPEPEYPAEAATEEARKAYWETRGKWRDKENKADQLATIAVDNYGRAQTALEHGKAEIRDAMIAKRMKQVNVPKITYAHIEIAGKKVATLDLEKVNATAKAKVLH